MHESGSAAGLRRTVRYLHPEGLQKLLHSRFSFDGFPESGGLETKLKGPPQGEDVSENPTCKADMPEGTLPPQGKSEAAHF